MSKITYRIWVRGEEKSITHRSIFSSIEDTLDHQWLGHGFDERVATLHRAIERLEGTEPSLPAEKPRIVVTQASVTPRSIERANEEYEELLQMLVK